MVRPLLALVAFTSSCALDAADEPVNCPDGKCDDTNGSDRSEQVYCEGNLIEMPSPGAALYYNGRYVGEPTPAEVQLPLGMATLGFATEEAYYERLIHVAEVASPDSPNCVVAFDERDRVEPRTWRALWIGVGEVAAIVDGAVCEVVASQVEIDSAFEFFESSLAKISDSASYAIKWEIDRVETATPVVPANESGFHHMTPEALAEVFGQLEVREYDTVFVFWKSAGADCAIEAPYFGLGWSPETRTKEMGFVDVKFHSADVVELIRFLRENDPGVWVHEWLHTVVEDFFPGLGADMPAAGEDGSIVHAAELYGYEAPWMTWYSDLIRGRVLDNGGRRGLSPDWLNRCTVRGGCREQTR